MHTKHIHHLSRRTFLRWGLAAAGVTVCPGENLEPLLRGMASDLGIEFGTGEYNGP